MKIKELIATLESAQEGNWELDREIRRVTDGAGAGVGYTKSVDAALTLCPERDADGLYWRIILERKPVHDTLAWIAEVRPHAAEGGHGIARSAALAICAAALRAMGDAK